MSSAELIVIIAVVAIIITAITGTTEENGTCILTLLPEIDDLPMFIVVLGLKPLMDLFPSRFWLRMESNRAVIGSNLTVIPNVHHLIVCMT